MYIVNVLMSTYNGMEYIEQQIDSIMKQKEVKTILTIRDDGSIDDTIKIIERLKNKYDKRITLYCGENLGYRKSFLSLLDLTISADYYCFSDQDDVWKEDKCIQAINCLTQNDEYLLYASAITITDKQLYILEEKKFLNLKLSIGSSLIRTRLPGCTYVFSDSLLQYIRLFSHLEYPEIEMPEHDTVALCCAELLGKVYVDNNSYILHRRTTKSVTAGGNGILKRIMTEKKILFDRKNVKYHLAKEIIEKVTILNNGDDIKLLRQVLNYKNSLADTCKLLVNNDFSCGLLLVDLEAKLKVLMHNF